MTRNKGEKLKSWEKIMPVAVFRRRGPKLRMGTTQVSLFLLLLLMESQAVSPTAGTSPTSSHVDLFFLVDTLAKWQMARITPSATSPSVFKAVRPHNHIIHCFLPVVPPNLSTSWLHTWWCTRYTHQIYRHTRIWSRYTDIHTVYTDKHTRYPNIHTELPPNLSASWLHTCWCSRYMAERFWFALKDKKTKRQHTYVLDIQQILNWPE